MQLQLLKSKIKKQSSIAITGSKSESNRLLLLQALYPEITIENVSNSDDTKLMRKALSSSEKIVDIHHAGTAMRFLTAYFSAKPGRETILTGSKRMKERPIKILVDALKELGADISYLENEGYPPIKITGKQLSKSRVSLSANVSSQYISALLLIAPQLKNGLELSLEGKITSVPYIKMTLSLLDEMEIETFFKNNKIIVKPQLSNLKPQTITVESDWSSASYFYSIVALSDIGTTIELSSYKKNSLQGDSVLAEIYKDFGVVTSFNKNAITIKKSSMANHQSSIEFDLSNSPDIAQTIVITSLGLGVGCQLTGLHTLKIKETDRLLALKTEINKLGGKVKTTDNSLILEPLKSVNSKIKIETYNDHRMAMAFAPLALKTELVINDAEVVSKSYPDFWRDLKSIGILISE